MRIAVCSIVTLILLTGNAGAGEVMLRFLSGVEASAALTGREAHGYYAQLQVAELRAKTGLPLQGIGLDAARANASKAYGSATEDFTDDERAALRDAIESMQPVLQARAPLYARSPWCFIKVNARIEGGLPHTRGDCIVLSDGVLQSLAKAHSSARFDQPSGVWDLLLHEQTHVLQRRNPALFAQLYVDVYGFQRAEVSPPDWLRLRRVVNPDAPLVEWIFPIGKEAARHWVLPDLGLTELEHPRMPADFKAVALGVHPLGGGRWALDEAVTPAQQAELESVAEYVDAFPVKGEAFHPNEIAAEMLAEIINGGRMQNPGHPLWARTRLWAEEALR